MSSVICFLSLFKIEARTNIQIPVTFFFPDGDIIARKMPHKSKIKMCYDHLIWRKYI